MYNIEFQTKLLANIIRNNSLQEQSLQVLDPHDFSYYICQFIWEVVLNYNIRVGSCMPIGALADEIANTLNGLYPANVSTLLPQEQEPLTDTVMNIYAEIPNSDYYAYLLPLFIKHQRSNRIISKLQDPDIDVDMRDALLHQLSEVKDLDLKTTKNLTFISDDPEILTSESNEIRVPTGLRLLDSRINDGLGLGEVGLITACPGVGKTTTLINIAYGAALAGLYPLFITLEVKSKLIKRRLIAMAAGIEGRWINKPIDTWPAKEQALYKEAIKSKVVNRVAIADMSSGRKTESTIKQVIAQWKKTIAEKYGNDAKAAVVCVDHLDELDPPDEFLIKFNKLRRDEQYKRVMSGLADLAKSMDMAIWVATQGTREAMDKQILDMQHVSSAFHKNDNITIGIGIAVKKSMDSEDEGPDPYSEYVEDFSNSGEELVFSVNKNRNGSKGYCILYRGPTLRYWDRMEDSMIEQRLIDTRKDVTNWHNELYQVKVANR